MPKFSRFEEVVYRSQSVLVSGLVVGYFQDLEGEYYVVIQDPVSKHIHYRRESSFERPTKEFSPFPLQVEGKRST